MDKKWYLNIDKHYNKIMIATIGSIVFFKMILMFLFSSDYQNEMFMPFVNTFISGIGNPYEYFYKNGYAQSFPYPPIMLYIMAMGGCLIRLFHVDSPVWQGFLFKLPLLCADLSLLFCFFKMFKAKRRYMVGIYFLSPLMLYSTYMHGQLDIIPIALLAWAMYFLTDEKNNQTVLFTLMLGLSTCSKFNILAVVPLLFLYLYRRKGIKKTLMALLGYVGLLAVVILPFWSDGFYHTVVSNREQTTITQLFMDYGSVKLYIPVIAVVLLYLWLLQLNDMNRDLLYCYVGIIFSVFLILVPPMPGWFVWIVPFVLYYFVNVDINRNKVLWQYAYFCATYVFYFIFCHRTEYTDLYFGTYSLDVWKIDNAVIKNFSFTLLCAGLLIIIVSMYRFGISQNAMYIRNRRPFTIGIAGDSGTGKSELLEKIESMFSEKRILYIEGDGDHRWERGDSNWEKYTHLDPKANYLFRQAKDLEVLRAGCTIRRTEYDHNTGTFSRLHRVVPKPYIIMCGLHSLYLPQMRRNMDLKIYMDTDEELRRYWKIQRDTGKRGYSSEGIVAQIERRIPDAEIYIYPQKRYADLSISYYDAGLENCFVQNHEVKLSVRMTITLDFDVEELVDGFQQNNIICTHTYLPESKYQIVDFGDEQLSHVTRDVLSQVAEMTIPQYGELFGEHMCWKDGSDGVLQIFILLLVSEKMRNAND